MYSVVLNVPVLRTLAIPGNLTSPSQLYRRTLSTDPSFLTYPSICCINWPPDSLIKLQHWRAGRRPHQVLKNCNEKLQEVLFKSSWSGGVIEMAELVLPVVMVEVKVGEEGVLSAP
jgi:hypothetical protein